LILKRARKRREEKRREVGFVWSREMMRRRSLDELVGWRRRSICGRGVW